MRKLFMYSDNRELIQIFFCQSRIENFKETDSTKKIVEIRYFNKIIRYDLKRERRYCFTLQHCCSFLLLRIRKRYSMSNLRNFARTFFCHCPFCTVHWIFFVFLSVTIPEFFVIVNILYLFPENFAQREYRILFCIIYSFS